MIEYFDHFQDMILTVRGFHCQGSLGNWGVDGDWDECTTESFV